MKFSIPEISWHNRDPVLSVDFQPKNETNGPLRLATGGTDSHVLIWYISTSESGSANIEVAADLTRHQKAVNIVRWSPNGLLLASGDDESIIFIWNQKTDKEPVQTVDQIEEQYKETWVIHKTLRGHMEDVLDLSWSPDSLHIASGSVDNKLLVWDVSRGRYNSIITDHKGFVQGVSWDPQGNLIASASTDRVFRTFDVTSKKVVSRSSKAILPFPSEHPLHDVKVRLFHDDTLQTYYRRLYFSPDGLLIAVPAGRIEPEQGKLDMKPINAVYIYTRYSLKVPACVVPCGEAALAARWSPRRYGRRARGPRPAFPARARQLLAVATKRSVMLYDTQQKTPLALISNIHYTRLTDLTWSPDGLTLVASSTDGFCSIITFGEDELGEVLPDDVAHEQKPAEPMEVEEQEQKEPAKHEISKDKVEEAKPSGGIQRIDSFIKFKTPSQRSPKRQRVEASQERTPVKFDVLEDAAMPPWADDSCDARPASPAPVVPVEDSEDIQLVYDESQSQSPVDQKDSPADGREAQKDSAKPAANEESPSRSTPAASSEFLHAARVTDVTHVTHATDVTHVTHATDVTHVTDAAPGPRAPRRVSFVTLSSPKNAKKK